MAKRGKIFDRIDLTKKQIRKSIKKTRGEIDEAEKDVINYIKKNPRKSVIIAAAVGAAVAGLAVAAKRR